MSFSEIEKAIVSYGNLAKENKLSLEDMKDGTFTISNGGVYGSDALYAHFKYTSIWYSRTA